MENEKHLKSIRPKRLFLAIFGMGTVGQGLVEILLQKEAWLLAEKGLSIAFTGIVTKSRGVFQANNAAQSLSAQEVLNKLQANQKFSGETLNSPEKLKAFLENPLHDIVIEATPTQLSEDAKSPSPAFFHMEEALKNSKHVVTANKGPIAEHYPYLEQLAQKQNCQLMIESTVLSGTPVFNLYNNGLQGNSLISLEAILNGTTNFILSEMENHNVSYTDALKKAQELGYAESNPDYDVSGKDAMLKTVILANRLFQASLSLDEVRYEGLEKLTLADIEQARKEKKQYKLISHIEVSEGVNNKKRIVAKVELKKISLTHPLASVKGALNAISFRTDLLGEVTIMGAGAGKMTAAYGLFHDILVCSSKKS